MGALVERFRTVGQPPGWLYVLIPVGAAVVFASLFPVGPDIVPDILLEGLYLGLTVLIAIQIRRLAIGVLEIGWLAFFFGRTVDFLDELFVEPEPLVEPYVSGFVMVVSFSILLAGTVTLLDDFQTQLATLRARTEELELKNAAIDEAPIGITIADMTREDEPLITVNDGFVRMTGYGADETIGRNCRFLQGEATSAESVARMRRAIEDRESVQVTVRNYRKDGTEFWNEIVLAPIERDGEITNYVGFQQDVTARKEFEHELQRQRDNITLLSRIVRHDIRNDLQIVRMHADSLADHATDDEHIETIKARAASAVDLTNTARRLAETMLDDGPELRAVPLEDSLERQIEEVRLTYRNVTVEVEGSIPTVDVRANEMLDSVFRNLLKNAVQHNDKAVPEITVSATRAGGEVTVRIADNGPGIPDDRKSEIFGHGEAGLDSGGTGIGTSLVDALVTRYGGDVRVEDNDPEGAVFVVALPVVDRRDW